MSPAAKTKTRLGAHTPTSGGMVKRSLGYAQTIGADAIQIFASNQHLIRKPMKSFAPQLQS